MSKTFTNRPSVARNGNPGTSNRNQTGAVPKTNTTRGRGRGTMATPTGRGRGTVPVGVGNETSAGQQINNENAEQQEQGLDQRMSYQGCYTMISPNEKKRQEIQRQAEAGNKKYQEYKDQRKQGYMSYVGTTGGGELSESQARSRLVQENRNPSMRLREKREEYRSQQKKKEEDEINEKRNRQRELTEKNKVRQQQTDRGQKDKWDEDMKRTREQFLSRLEGKSNQTRSSGEVISEPRPSYSQNTSTRASDTYTAVDMPGAYGNMHLSDDDLQSDIETLQSIFPHYDRTVLKDILDQTHSVEAAIEMLQG